MATTKNLAQAQSLAQTQSLAQAEKQIETLLAQNRSNWQAIAKIAIAVQQNKLFKESGLSFSAWVQQLATRCDCQRSLIWRYIKAGKYYLRIVDSEDLEQIDAALAAPEALVNLEKVERHAPKPVYQGLREKVLDGVATVRECREQVKQYKPISENRRGRPPLGTEGTYQHLGRRELGQRELGQRELGQRELGQRELGQRELGRGDNLGQLEERQLTGGQLVGQRVDEQLVDEQQAKWRQLEWHEIPPGQVAQGITDSLAITLVDWTKICAGMRYPPRHHVTHTEVRVNLNRKRLRLDFVGVIRWSNKRPKDIFGIEVKSSLTDFEHDQKWQNYLQLCDYFCFALPTPEAELIQMVQETVQKEVGILAVDIPSERVEVLRTPHKLNGEMKYLLYETLYERALGWSGSETSSK